MEHIPQTWSRQKKYGTLFADSVKEYKYIFRILWNTFRKLCDGTLINIRWKERVPQTRSKNINRYLVDGTSSVEH